MVESTQSPEQVIVPSDEIDKVPDKLPDVPSLLVYVPVNVPSELIVSVTVSNEESVPAYKTLPCQAPAKSWNEYDDEGWLDRIMRLEDPSDHVCVHAIKVLLESIWHREVWDGLFRVITIPLEATEKEPARL